jgi:hypothetical protein
LNMQGSVGQEPSTSKGNKRRECSSELRLLLTLGNVPHGYHRRTPVQPRGCDMAPWRKGRCFETMGHKKSFGCVGAKYDLVQSTYLHK